MAFPATDIYRKEWQSPSGTGWNFRLDIVPYLANLSSNVIPLSGAEANAVEVGAIEARFAITNANDIAIGLQQFA